MKLKRYVLRRDAGRCYVCGNDGADEVDHITPLFEGGGDALTNLGSIHSDPCHKRKTAREAARAKRIKRATRRR